MTTDRFDYEIRLNNRLAGQPRYYLLARSSEDKLVNLPDVIRNCVAFILYETPEGTFYSGTTFFVRVDDTDGGRATKQETVSFLYAITARHVIDGIRRRGSQVKVRVNDRHGSSRIIDTDPDNWLTHPTDATTDVTVLPWSSDADLDIGPFPITPHSSAVDASEMEKRGLGIGDSIYSVGLFWRHAGSSRNLPIVRAGIIAAMPQEPVITPLGDMTAYLVELRSIKGLSGSPVFIQTSQQAHSHIGLLGIMHGHWSVSSSELDAFEQGSGTISRLNVGIGVVVPIDKALDIINQPLMVEHRNRVVAEIRASRATPLIN
jgi:hypothetical protein